MGNTHWDFESFVEDANIYDHNAHYSPDTHRLVYDALGLAGEVGEVVNIVKKLLRDHNGVMKDELHASLCDELGDVFHYATRLLHSLNVSLNEVLGRNITKISNREGLNPYGYLK